MGRKLHVISARKYHQGIFVPNKEKKDTGGSKEGSWGSR